jgi:hypothetical protein
MFDRWFFITVVSVTLVLIVPLVVVWLILQVGPELRFVATVAIIVAWGVVSGYKDWIISKRKEQQGEPPQI